MNKLFYLRFLRKFKLLRNRQIELPLTLNAQEFIVPIAHELGFNNHNMDEFWMMDLFKQFNLNPTDELLDLGANVGQTLLKWKAIYPENKYIGLEPLPDCIKYLNLLCQKNNFIGCTIIDKALFNKTRASTLNLQFNDPTDRTATIIDGSGAIKQINIETIDIETLFNYPTVKKENIKVIKIDVEGSELEIIQNALSFIIEFKPFIILEVLATKNHNFDRIKQINTLLKKLQYSIYRIKKKNNHLDSLEQLLEIVPPLKVIDSDYLLLPK